MPKWENEIDEKKDKLKLNPCASPRKVVTASGFVITPDEPMVKHARFLYFKPTSLVTLVEEVPCDTTLQENKHSIK
jgi:hypothetical protein